ncbi:hypothetical protein J3F83DRAFT_684782 [Trichoderma novae-zelandiae]
MFALFLEYRLGSVLHFFLTIFNDLTMAFAATDTVYEDGRVLWVLLGWIASCFPVFFLFSFPSSHGVRPLSLFSMSCSMQHIRNCFSSALWLKARARLEYEDPSDQQHRDPWEEDNG